MRICLVTQEYPPETAKGGIGTQNYGRATGLTELGHQVTVLSHSLNDARHEENREGVRVVRIPGYDSRFPIATEAARWLTYSARVAEALHALHAKSPFDLVVFPEWGGEGYVHLLNQIEWNRIPSIVHIHGSVSMFTEGMGWPEKDSELYRVATEMESTCLRLADAVSASSRFSADWCTTAYQLKREFIPVLHVGVNTQLFCPGHAKADRPTIIFVGSIVLNKGIPHLVDASIRLAKKFPNLSLRILGKGDERLMGESRKRAAAAGFPELIDFMGYVSREELPTHLSRAHVFAGPSLFEGGPGNVYLEAMACGIPVIATSGTGVSETVIHGETGFLVAPGDVNALAEKIDWLFSNPKLREEMGKTAREHVMREADARVCLKRLEAFYSAVASGKPYDPQEVTTVC